MSTVLVTGGAGFIGSHLVDALLDEGHSVRIVDNLSTGFQRNIDRLNGRAQFIKGDLAEAAVARESCRDIEFVFHQAALPSVPRSLKDPLATQRSGEVATLTLLEACAQFGIKRVMFSSSSSAYGGTTGLPKVETMTPAPLSPYAASKVGCENYIAAYAHCRGIDAIAFRYFNVFGPRQDPNSPYSAVISVFLSRMRKGEAPHINGDGEHSRDFTFVDNVVHANLLAMKASGPLKGRVCNVGCGERITIKDLVAALNAALGTSIEPTYGPARSGDALHSQADITRARELLGYQPQVRFADGIQRLVNSTES